MTVAFSILTVVFIVLSAAMVLIILVQRPQGGGLAGAFGGAGGSGTDTVFGGRVGDALTVMTVIAFVLYLGLAIGLNLMDPAPTSATAADTATEVSAPLVTPSPTGPGSTPPPISITPESIDTSAGTITPSTPGGGDDN